MMKLCAWFLPCVLLAIPAIADDWPQWQGPDRNAISQETGLLQQWPENGPPLAWRVEGLGGGDSAPAVVGGRLYGMSNRDGKEIVWARSEADGKEIWVTALGDAVDQRMPQSKEGPGCTPSVDEDRLYVIGMGGRVACLNIQSGEVLWQRSMTEDFGGVVPMWSYRESPLIDGDRVICTPGGSDALIAALDKLNGETIWKSQLPGASTQPSAGQQGADQRASDQRGAERFGRPGGRRPTTDQTEGQAQAESPNRERSGNDRSAEDNSAPQVTGTKDPALFLSEHWGMTGFAQKVPNGKYLVNLYFAETYAGITGPGQRVFTLNVEGTEIKDFDIWQKAGGPRKAYVESVPVEVADGELQVTFTRQAENPAIKAIEILPQDNSDSDAKPIRIKAGQTTPFTDSKGQVWLAEQGFIGGQTSPGFVNLGNFGGGFGGRPDRFRGTRGGGFGGGFGGGARPSAAYASVIPIDFEGERQYVQLTASALVGVSATDGKILWQYNAPANAMGINCSTPIYHDGLVFAASAYGTGGGAVKLVKNADGGIEAEEVYFATSMQNHHGGMIVIDGALYGANGGNGGGFLTCLDFETGDVLWRDRQAPKGSLVFADGRLYLRSEDGPMVLVEPSKEGFVERGRFDQPDRSSAPAWAHPIIANGKLYIRDQDLLLCYDIQAK